MEGVTVSFQHANANQGNESFVIRVRSPGSEHTPCILVDAGHGVDVDALLTGDDVLEAILLTHAHRDHYQTLAENHRPSTPILTGPHTRAILEDVLTVAEEYYEVAESSEVLSSLQGCRDWTSIAAGITVCPFPVGHTPGAAGFCVRVETPEETITIVVTGDFTTRRAGGFPGFEPDRLLGADILFLTGATNDDFERAFTAAVEQIFEQATSGGPVLVTASGLNGVHLAFVLAVVQREYDIETEIRVVGQVAKHYTNLEYDLDEVTAIPVFEDPGTCLSGGTVTIAGPEVPIEGSSGRLFQRIEQAPSAALVQVTSGSYDPIETAGCDISHFVVKNHPPEASIDAVAESLQPIQTVITHQMGESARRFSGRWKSFVWAPGNEAEHVLYDAGSWRAPPWATTDVESVVRSRSANTIGTLGNLEGALELPELDRRSEDSLAAEGILLDRLETTLETLTTPSPHPEGASATSASNDVTDGAERDGEPEQLASTPATDTQQADTQSMTSDNQDSSDERAEATDQDGTTLYDTISGLSAPDPSDGEFELTDSSPTDIISARARRQLGDDSDSPADVDDRAAGHDTDSDAHSETPSNDTKPPDGGEAAVPEDTEEDGTSPDSADDPAAAEYSFDLDPLLVALLQWVVETRDDTPSDVGTAVAQATERHLASILRGGPDAADTESVTVPPVSVTTSPSLEAAIAASDDIGDETSVDSVVRELLVDLVPVDTHQEQDDIEIHSQEFVAHLDLVDSALENDQVEPTTRAGFIEDAISVYLATVVDRTDETE